MPSARVAGFIPRRALGVLSLSALCFVQVFTPVSEVRADQFVPVPSPPIVDIVSAPGASAADPIQPKFPDSGGRVYTVTAASGTGEPSGTATLTAAGHGVDVGDEVEVSGVSGYNGTFTVTAVTASTFSFVSSASTPLASISGQVRVVSSLTAVTAAVGNGTTAVLTAAGHGLQVGDRVTVSGVTGYNGTFTVTAVTASTFSFASTTVSSLSSIVGGTVQCASCGVYTVAATVTTNATLAALETVTMCWYRAAIVGADTNCAVLDPEESFAMRWTEATAAASPAGGTAGFEVLAGASPFDLNAYRNDGSRTETTSGVGSYASTNNTMTIKFSFRVSNAMLASDNWVVKVTAVYEDELCGGDSCGWDLDDRDDTDTWEDRHVAYWGEMTTAWEPLGFGVVAEGGTSPEVSATGFEFVANADSDYSLTGTDFESEGTATTDTLELVTGVPSGKQVRFDCKASDHAGADFEAVGKTAVALGANITPTSETINDDETIVCKLSYGGNDSGRALYALRIYSATVALAIGQK